MTIYYIKMRKSRRREQKAKFWESNVIERKTEHGQLTSERTKRTCTKRYINKRREKIQGIQVFFSLGRRLWIFYYKTSVCIEFHAIDKPSSWKIKILRNLTKFYAFVQFFQLFVNCFCNFLITER